MSQEIILNLSLKRIHYRPGCTVFKMANWSKNTEAVKSVQRWKKSTACRWLMKLSIEYRLKNNYGETHEISSNHSVNHYELLHGVASFLYRADDGGER